MSDKNEDTSTDSEAEESVEDEATEDPDTSAETAEGENASGGADTEDSEAETDEADDEVEHSQGPEQSTAQSQTGQPTDDGPGIVDKLKEPPVRTELAAGFGNYVLLGIGLVVLGILPGLLFNDIYGIAIAAVAIGSGPLFAIFSGRSMADADVEQVVGAAGIAAVNAVGYFALMFIAFIVVLILDPFNEGTILISIFGGFIGAVVAAAIAAASFLLARFV